MRTTRSVLPALVTALVVGGATLAAAPADAVVLHAADDHPGHAKGHADKKPKKDNPGRANGHAKQKANGRANGHARSVPVAPLPTGGAGEPAGASENENEKITFCHVPPGNPDNGHLITTSVNAIDPGHLNHPGDIIPPFTFVKHGETIDFPGQNWDDAGRAALAEDCTAEEEPVVVPTTPPGEVGGISVDAPASGVEAASLDAAVDAEEDAGLADALLPDTGGARLGVLLLGLGLVGTGAYVLSRRRRLA